MPKILMPQRVTTGLLLFLAGIAEADAKPVQVDATIQVQADYDAAWHWFDPVQEVVYRADEGTIANVAQLEPHPARVHP